MAKIPGQRKAGQTGGGGRIHQTGNRNLSGSRGGRPHAGGGGTGKKPGSGGGSKAMVVIAVAMLIVPAAAILTVVGYVVAGNL